MIKFQHQNEKKKKKKLGRNFLGDKTGAISGLQIRVGFRDYKSGQEELQIGSVLGISHRPKKITNRGRDFKSWKERFQIGAEITNWEKRDFN